MLQTTNIIFIERSLFIYLAAGLICVQQYCKTGKLKWAAWFLFFMNFSIYVKETAILFYFGLISTSIIYQIWNEQINLKSFLHPFRTIKQMPLEFLMILSLFLYSVIYFLLLSLKVNYHVDNSFSLGFLLDYYKFELIFIATASLILGLNTFKSLNSSANPLFSSGSFLFGGICVTAGVVFVLHLAPISPHLNTRTYYLVIPVLFSLAYLFTNIKNSGTLVICSFLILGYSFVQNLSIYRQEPGHYYRQAAEFFAKNLDKNKPNAIYLAEKPFSSRFDKNLWMTEVWAASFRYYFKGYQIVFRYYNEVLSKLSGKQDVPPSLRPYFFKIMPYGLPDPGDWLVVNKQLPEESLTAYRLLAKFKPVFENDLFEIYLIR